MQVETVEINLSCLCLTKEDLFAPLGFKHFTKGKHIPVFIWDLSDHNHLLQLFWDSEVFPNQPWENVSSLPEGLLLVGCAQNTSPVRCPEGILTKCPNHLNLLLCRRAATLLFESQSADWSPRSVLQGEPSSSWESTQFVLDFIT